MALADCIARVGDALLPEDKAYLESKIAEGVTDDDALNGLQESVTASITAVARRVQEEGGDIATELGPRTGTPEFFSQTTRPTDSPLFFSVAERAVETMNLPGWKNNGEAYGHEILEKILASDVKLDEIEWMGLEEFLGGPFKRKLSNKKMKEMKKNNPEGLKNFLEGQEVAAEKTDKKFSREQVKGFMQSEGVLIHERIADNSASGTDKIRFGNAQTMDDDSEWDHEIDYMMDEIWDPWVLNDTPSDTDPHWFDHDDREQEIERYYTDEMADYYGRPPEEDDLAEGEVFVDYDNMNRAEQFEYYKDLGHDPANDMAHLPFMRNESESKAREKARMDYYDNPKYEYRADVGENYMFIRGREDEWELEHDGDQIDEFSTYDEAVVAAKKYAEEEGLIDPDAIFNKTQWGNESQYIARGSYDEYRELKVILPNISPAFKSGSTHRFKDENLCSLCG